MIRVLIADGRAHVREGLKALLEAQNDIQVVGSARNGRDAVCLAEELNPSVVLMDSEMPVVSGLAATKMVKSREGAPAVIVLTMEDHEWARQRAALAGADAFVSKSSGPGPLVETIHRVAGSGRP